MTEVQARTRSRTGRGSEICHIALEVSPSCQPHDVLHLAPRNIRFTFRAKESIDTQPQNQSHTLARAHVTMILMLAE
jgi:hypothetical protein